MFVKRVNIILICSTLILVSSPLQTVAKRPTTVSQHAYPILKGRAQTVAVPAETVMNVALANTLNSRQAKLGDPVIAAVKKPVYVGPYLAVPVGTNLLGRIADINRKAIKNGPNPYIVVNFSDIKRPEDKRPMAIQASLIAYRTGLQKEDYLWKLPQKHDKLKSHIGSTLEGAAIGFFINPILGPVIGAGAGLLKSITITKIAERGIVKIKAGQDIPISLQEALNVPVTSIPSP